VDKRYQIFKERLHSFTTEEVQMIRDGIDSICLDTFNYDETRKTFCPMAIGMNLHKTIDNPTDAVVTEAIGKRFTPANALKGTSGTFYTTNRKEDLLALCEEVISEKMVDMPNIK
jgi:hypothetical protein